jgi:hypothetical protein
VEGALTQPPTAGRRRRIADALPLLALAGLWAHFAASLGPTWAPRANDFAGYYGAGRAVAMAPETLYRSERKWFTNLPIVAVPLASLARLDYPTAWRVNWWLELASFAGGFGLVLWTIHRRLQRLTAPVALAAGAVYLCFAPVARHSLELGQTTPLVALLLAAFPLLHGAGFRRSAGALLGLACLIKIPPLLLVAGLAVRRRLEAALAALAVVAAGVALSFAVFGPELVGQYADRVIFDNLGRAQAAFNNRSLDGAFMRMFSDRSLVDWDTVPRPPAVTAAVAATALLLAALVFARGRGLWWPARPPDDADPRTGSLELEWALGTALLVLVFPVVWIHYYLLLAAPLALIPFWWEARRVPRRALAIALLAAGTWLASGTVTQANHYYGRYQAERAFRLAQNVQTLGALLVAVGLSWPLAEIARRLREASAEGARSEPTASEGGPPPG